MTLKDIQERLYCAHAIMHFEGHVDFRMTPGAEFPFTVLHWFTEPDGRTNCKAFVGATPEECLDDLDRYALAYRRPPTTEEVGRMLGLTVEQPAPSYALAAE